MFKTIDTDSLSAISGGLDWSRISRDSSTIGGPTIFNPPMPRPTDIGKIDENDHSLRRTLDGMFPGRNTPR